MDDNLPLAASDSDIDALLDDWLATPAAPLVTVDTPGVAADAAPPAEPAGEMSLLAALAEDALAIGAAEQAVITDGRAAAGRKDHYVIFTSAGSSYAVLETSVTEVSRIPRLTLVPRVPDWLRGVTSLRGEVLSVVDLRVFLGLEPTSLHTGRLLVVRLTDEEFSLGIRGIGRVVTIGGEPVGALSVAVPKARFDEAVQARVVDMLERTAGLLETG